MKSRSIYKHRFLRLKKLTKFSIYEKYLHKNQQRLLLKEIKEKKIKKSIQMMGQKKILSTFHQLIQWLKTSQALSDLHQMYCNLVKSINLMILALLVYNHRLMIKINYSKAIYKQYLMVQLIIRVFNNQTQTLKANHNNLANII